MESSRPRAEFPARPWPAGGLPEHPWSFGGFFASPRRQDFAGLLLPFPSLADLTRHCVHEQLVLRMSVEVNKRLRRHAAPSTAVKLSASLSSVTRILSQCVWSLISSLLRCVTTCVSWCVRACMCVLPVLPDCCIYVCCMYVCWYPAERTTSGIVPNKGVCGVHSKAGGMRMSREQGRE